MAHCMVDPDEAYEERRDNEAGFNDWPQEKSADEMFKDLGYLWQESPPEGGRGYADEDDNGIAVTRNNVTFMPAGSKLVLTMGAKTILACAKAIEEMEAEK